jgi:hypothetical protein
MTQNPLAQNIFSESSEAIPSYSQAQVRNNFLLGAPRRIENPQQSATLMQLETQSPYGLQELQSPRLESAMPLPIANANSHGWIMGCSAANFSRFPKAQYSSNAFSYADQVSVEINDGTSISSSAAGPSLFSLYDASPASDSFESNKIEPDTVYTSPFEQEVVPSSYMAVSTTASAMASSFNNGKFWYEMGQNSNSVNPSGMDLPFTYDGLPDVAPVLWPTESGSSSTWSQQTAPPGTISPQALSLMAPFSPPIPGDSSPISNSGWLSETSATSQVFHESVGDMPHLTAQSARSKGTQSQSSDRDMPHATARSVRSRAFYFQSSGSDMPHSTFRPATSQGFQISQSAGDIANPTIQSVTSREFQLQRSTSDRPHPTKLCVTSEANNVDGSADDMPRLVAGSATFKGFQTQQSAGAVQHPPRRVLRPRRKLPSEPASEVYIPPLSINGGVISRSHKGLVIARSRTHSGRPDDPQSSRSTARQYPRKISSMQRPLRSEKSERKVTEKQISGTMTEAGCAATSSGAKDTAQLRIAKDKFLLDSKREGKSYKHIRLEGGFTEAESTLRGRHRTLIKRPEERVRKPEWESNDVRSSVLWISNLGTANSSDSYASSKKLSVSLQGIPAYRDRRRSPGRKFLTISSTMVVPIALAIRHVGRSGVSYMPNLVIRINLD